MSETTDYKVSDCTCCHNPKVAATCPKLGYSYPEHRHNCAVHSGHRFIAGVPSISRPDPRAERIAALEAEVELWAGPVLAGELRAADAEAFQALGYTAASLDAFMKTRRARIDSLMGRISEEQIRQIKSTASLPGPSETMRRKLASSEDTTRMLREDL